MSIVLAINGCFWSEDSSLGLGGWFHGILGSRRIVTLRLYCSKLWKISNMSTPTLAKFGFIK